MSIARPLKNTSKAYLCTNCGSVNTSIVREGPNPRLKCSACQFMFDGFDSVAAQENGQIPNEAPTLQDTRPPERVEPSGSEESSRGENRVSKPTAKASNGKVPRSPSYVLITKTRDETEFVTKKTLNGRVLQWTAQGKKFDVFELSPKSVTAKIDIK